MKKSAFFCVLPVLLFWGCAAPKIVEKDYKYEKLLFERHNFEFEFHLENIESFGAAEALIKKLIYKDMNFDEYAAYLENWFTSQFDTRDYPPMIDEDGTEYLYRSYFSESYNIEHYNDSFIIIKSSQYLYYTGGAHGGGGDLYFIIDIAEEKIIGLNDLLTPIPDEILTEAIQAQHEISYFLRDNIWPPDTISFNKQNIVPLWNVYSITPYATGPVSIEIPYETGDLYLTEKGKALKLSISRARQ